MEFQKYYEQKINVANLETITYAILMLEENLFETTDVEQKIERLGNLLYELSSYSKEIQSGVLTTGVLEYYRLNISTYKSSPKISRESFLCGLRISLRNLFQGKNVADHIFDMILKTMLFIDYSDLSIDMIVRHSLEIKSKDVPQIEKKKLNRKKV